MVTTRELLILKHDDLRSEVSTFFKALNKDSALRNLFFTNPILVLRTKLPSLRGIEASDEIDSLANKVLFAALSNEKFLTFLEKFQARKNEALKRLQTSPKDKRASAELDDRAMTAELAEALINFGDKELLSNLLSASSVGRRAAPPVLITRTILLVEAVVVLGIEVVVHTVVRIGITGDLGPKPPISAQALRKIANELVTTAKQARAAGDLS